jgi:hypothetical protein
LTPEDLVITIAAVAAGAIITIAVARLYYKKASNEVKERFDKIDKRQNTLESLGVLNMKLQQAPDPSRIEHEKRKQDDLYVTKGRKTVLANAVLVMGKISYPVRRFFA